MATYEERLREYKKEMNQFRDNYVGNFSRIVCGTSFNTYEAAQEYVDKFRTSGEAKDTDIDCVYVQSYVGEESNPQLLLFQGAYPKEALDESFTSLVKIITDESLQKNIASLGKSPYEKTQFEHEFVTLRDAYIDHFCQYANSLRANLSTDKQVTLPDPTRISKLYSDACKPGISPAEKKSRMEEVYAFLKESTIISWGINLKNANLDNNLEPFKLKKPKAPEDSNTNKKDPFSK